MSLEAVIFDLFGTLVDNWPLAVLNDMHTRVAEMVGAPPDAFMRVWAETWEERNRGDLPTAADNTRLICERLGVPPPTPEQLAAADEFRMQVCRETFLVRSDAIETLRALRERGLKLGMISDCSWEAPVVWAESPFAPLFDVAVFSVLARVKKPDPRIYLMACEQLGVRPQGCLYVGDGGSRELTGAAAVGMRAVMIRVPYEVSDATHRVEGEEWEGETVSALGEVVGIL
jgi:putative hydrolase of the HAD superfamily